MKPNNNVIWLDKSRNHSDDETSHTEMHPYYKTFGSAAYDKKAYSNSHKLVFIPELPTPTYAIFKNGKILYNINSEFESYGEIATTKESGDIMDHPIQQLISRLDQDIRDHKQEVRDRDARLQTEMQERDQRYREELKERENRIIVLMEKSSQEAKEREERFITELKEFKADMISKEENINSMLRDNRWGWIATVIAIVALVLSIIYKL